MNAANNPSTIIKEYIFKEKIVYIEKLVEVPIEKIVYREKIVEVPFEKIIYKDRIVEIPSETVVYSIPHGVEYPIQKIYNEFLKVKKPKLFFCKKLLNQTTRK